MMTLQESYNIVENFKKQSTKKHAIKVYDKFLQILNALKTRTFTEDELHSIEAKLERLNLASIPTNRRKHLKKALATFEKYLKETFALTTKDHYTTLYGGLGLSAGLLFGVVFLSQWDRSLGISMGLIFGMVIGATIGRSIDTKAMNEGRVL